MFYNIYNSLTSIGKDMTTVEKLDDYLTVSEAAQYLAISWTTLRNWDKTGKLTPYRHPINGYRLYLAADLDRILTTIKRNTIDHEDK